MAKMIGIAMNAILFAGLFAVCVVIAGFEITALAYAITALIVIWIWISVELTMKD